MQLTSHYNYHRTSLYTMFLVHLSGVKMHFLFQLWTVQRTASHVWKLAFADWHLWKFVLVHVLGKVCGQRWAVVRSTVSCQQCGWLYARHYTSFAAVMTVVSHHSFYMFRAFATKRSSMSPWILCDMIWPEHYLNSFDERIKAGNFWN
jgi:hypothetical protein